MKSKKKATIKVSLFSLLTFILFTNASLAQTTCSLGNPVFVEDFGSGTNRLGPSLNQDPNTNVHPNFRPASLYSYIGSGSVGHDQYGIMKNPKDAAPGGASWNDSFSDHTGNQNGYLYYCDAKEDLKVFYAQKIDGLCEEIEYELSAWFAKTNAPDYYIDPNIKLIIGFTDINDQNIGSIVETDTGPIEGVGANRWQRKSLVFTVPSSTENIYFMLKNNVSGVAGNDLAIDDIEVRPCGPQIDITDQTTNTVINNQSLCITNASDLSISLSANIPTNFVMQWQESTELGIWMNIIGETSSLLNYTINSSSLHQIRLKFAHNPNNLLNTSCHFYTNPVSYYRAYANTATIMRLCDDDNNGTMPFDLTMQDDEINTTSGMSITYHTTLADAETGNAPISNPYESGNTTIYARVENDANNTCYDTSSFDLEVYDSAFPLLNVTPLQECDDTSVGTDVDGFIIFDLTQKEDEILNGQSASDFSLTYFTDASYTNQIITPSNYTNEIAGNQTIYVRVTSDLYSICHTDTTFEIEVFELPIVNNPSIYAQCDDASNDGQAFFNLTLDLIKEEINPNYIAKGLTFTYFLTQNDAQNATNPILNPDNYQDALGFTPETVWVRLENPNGCYREVPLTLEVNPSSAALSVYNPIPIYQCDDGLDTRDGIATFNFTHIRDHIANSIFSTFNASIHFYETQMDAELETNEIKDIANHQNTKSPNIQSIWVRIKSDLGNNCLGLEELPNLLNVEALPFANLVSLDRQCDYHTSDTILSYPFDTSLVESTVLGNQNPANVNIRYFDETGTELPNPLPNPFLTENQSITILVTNNNTQDPDGPCYDETTLAFIVDEQPIIANTVPPQIACDGDSGDVDDDDYFPFDTSSFSGTILGTQTNMEIYFDYVDENGNFVIDSPTLPNPLNSTNQTVNVDVINPINPSCYVNTTIDLIVNPLPDFYIDSEYIVCTSDPLFAIELDPVESNVIESFTYEWRYTSIDGSTVNQLLPDTTPTIYVSFPGTYHVTLTKKDGTGCSRTRDIFVNASELATITHDDVTILDFNENNNSVTIDTTNLGQGNYEFALVEQDSNFINYQDAPEFNNVKPGFYTIYVNDKNGCGAITLDISVIGYMKFFTPNNDGFNDYWKIIGVNAFFQPNSRILVFDRYGKPLKQISTLEEGWDGTYNGNMMSSDDYWFKVLLEDGREFMGHFALKR